MTDHRPSTERALKEITAALDTLAATITAALDNLAATVRAERDLAEARAKVERLTAERDRLEAAQYLSDGSAWGGPVREPTVQKGAESNAESIDPADVQPGEAWLVKVDRETRTAVKDTDAAIPWNTVNPSGVFHAEYNEDVTLLTRLVPAPRTITNPDDLDRAKRDTIIRDARGVVCSRDSAGTAWTTFTNLTDQRRHIVLPATVLWEPEA